MSDLYILDDEDRPVPCDDARRWSQWMEANRTRCHIHQERVQEYWISTIFSGMADARYMIIAANGGPYKGAPDLFETAVFCGHHLVSLERTPTRTDAEKTHAEAVASVQVAVDN